MFLGKIDCYLVKILYFLKDGYRFSLSITDLRNGLTLWEGEEKIKKLADKNAVTW